MNVAVLMAVYSADSSVLFERALRSMIEQRLPSATNLRIYLGVDGPLPAHIERTIEHFQASLFAVVRNEKCLGLARTLNRLLERLDDEAYVFRMDSDDRSLPDRIQLQLEFMEANPEIGILGSSIVELYDGQTRGRVVHFAESPEQAREMICRRVPVAHPTVCIRRSVFARVPRYPEIANNEDIAMWFKCMGRGVKFSSLPEPLLEFSINSDFFVRRGREKALSEFRCYWQGIRSIWGANWRLLFPVFRLLFRLSPASVRRFFYRRR